MAVAAVLCIRKSAGLNKIIAFDLNVSGSRELVLSEAKVISFADFLVVGLARGAWFSVRLL